MSDRCIWSNRRDAETRTILLDPGPRHRPERYPVCPEHEAQLRRWIRFTRRWSGRFMAAFGMLAFLLVLFAMLSVWWGLALVCLALGLLVLLLPFSTPQTVWLLGVRGAIWTARVVGMLLIGLGGWIFWTSV